MPSVDAESSTSSHPSKTSARSSSSVSSIASLIDDRVVKLADGSADRSDFYRRLASELVENFECGLVAVQASHWSAPMMLVTDDPLSKLISRSELCELLASAGDSPVACNITLDPTERHDDSSLARGLSVEISVSPDRATLLFVYPLRSRPPAITQVDDLRRLAHYGESARRVVG